MRIEKGEIERLAALSVDSPCVVCLGWLTEYESACQGWLMKGEPAM